MNKALNIARIVDSFVDALRAVKGLYEVKKVVDNIKIVNTLIDNIGAIVLEIPGGNQTVENIADMCESEKVWENYYGHPKVWDSIKKISLDVVEWLATRIVSVIGS